MRYVLLCLLVCCTAHEATTAKIVLADADIACKGLLALDGAPEFAPLCATAEEVGDAVVDLVATRYAAASTDAERQAALAYHPPKAEIHRHVARRRAAKKGTK